MNSITMIPQRHTTTLYGRDKEIEQLHTIRRDLFEGEGQKSRSRSRLIVVQGASGTGKSSLVQRAFATGDDLDNYSNNNNNNSSSSYYFFGCGKYDEGGQAASPYGAIMEAIQEVTESIESGQRLSFEAIEEIKNKLKESKKLQESSRILSYVPSLKRLVLGEDEEEEPTTTASSSSSSSPHRSGSFVLQNNKNETERLKQEISEFMRILARPIIIMIDDLQWADPMSVELLTALLQPVDCPHQPTCLWVATMRTTPPPPSAAATTATSTTIPTTDTVATSMPISKSLIHATLSLDALTSAEIQEWLLSKLDCHDNPRYQQPDHPAFLELQKLVDLVYQKTMGNAFYVSMFVNMLQSEGQVWYDVNALAWKFDIQKLQNDMVISTNVVDFLIDKIQSLPEATRMVLNIASCFGTKFDTAIIQQILRNIRLEENEAPKECWQQKQQQQQQQQQQPCPLQTVVEVVGAAVERGVVERRKAEDDRRYRFAHDRIHQAFYSTLGQDRENMHLRIGRFLWRRLEHKMAMNQQQAQQQSELAVATNDDPLLQMNTTFLMLLTTEQLNQGRGSMLEWDERLSLAKLNLVAAKAARRRSAFLAACNFCKAGLSLLNQHDSWKGLYDLTLSLHTLKAQMDFIIGDREGTRQSVDEVLQNATTLEDKIPVYIVKMESFSSEGFLTEAIYEGLYVLQQMGVKIPQSPSLLHLVSEIFATRRLLRGKTDEMILALPELDCHFTKSKLEVLSLLGGYAYAASQPTMVMMVGLREMRFLLQDGLSRFSADTLATYGVLMGQMGNFADAHRFGQLSVTLMDRFQRKQHSSKTVLAIHFFLHHLRKPIHESIEPLLLSYRVGMELGDVRNASLSFFAYICCYAMCGLPLGPVLQDTDSFRLELGNNGQDLVFKMTSTVYQTMLNLVGKCKNPLLLTGEAMNQDEMLKEAAETKNLLLAQNIHLQRAILAVYFNDFVGAGEAASEIWDDVQIKTGSCNFMTGVTYFVLGLAALGITRPGCKRRDKHCPSNTRKYKRESRRYIKKLGNWAKQGEANVMHMWLILLAEQAFVNGGKTDDVKKAYDKAITVATRSGFLQNAALANERAGIFFLERNDSDYAELYIVRAYQLYSDWGASAKLKQMKQRYPFLRTSEDLRIRPSTQHYGRSRFSPVSQHWTSSSTDSFIEESPQV